MRSSSCVSVPVELCSAVSSPSSHAVSAPAPEAELNDLALMLYGKTLDLLTEDQLEDLKDMLMNNKQMPKDHDWHIK